MIFGRKNKVFFVIHSLIRTFAPYMYNSRLPLCGQLTNRTIDYERCFSLLDGLYVDRSWCPANAGTGDM